MQHPRSFWGPLCLFAAEIFMCSLAMGAGSIHGIVKGNQQPIIGATVRLLELDRIARTDLRGEFLFPNIPEGTYRVFVRVVGYASMTDTVVAGAVPIETSFSLHESTIEAEEIVVSASLTARSADEQYQSAESKSLTDLHASPGTSFAEKIEDLPGVTVRSNGSAPSRPMLRGLSDNRVLILENGLRTGDISTYDPAHAVPIEAASIYQIDIVRGPASILYGPSTIGGLVNVITNVVPTASSEGVSGTASLEGNTVSDEYSGYVNTVYSHSGHSISLSGGGLHSQDIRIPTGSYVDPGSGTAFDLSRMPQSFNHISEFGAGYSYEGGFGTVGIGGKHYEMNYGIPGVPPNPDWLNVPPATSRIAQKKNLVELRSLLATNGPVIKQIKFDANYVDYNHSEFPTAQDSTGVSDPQANHFHNRTFNATLQFQHRLSEELQGAFGLWANVEDLAISGDQPLGPNSTTTGLAGYVIEEYLVNENSRLQAGLRFDYNHIKTSPDATSQDSVFQILDVERSSNAVTASLGAIQKLTPDVTASLSTGRSFRAPTVQELYANGLDAASSAYSKGDATLNPETGLGIDASLKGRFSNMVFEISPYVNIIKNYIYAFLTGDTLQAFPVRQFAATDARLIGIEAVVDVEPAHNIAVRASFDYVSAQDTKNDVPLPFTPPMRGLLRLTYQDQTYSGVLEWRLAARQTRLGDGDTPTAGYGIVNLSGGVRFVCGGLVQSVSVHCDNLLDQVYRDNLSMIKDFLPQPARGFRLNYDVQF